MTTIDVKDSILNSTKKMLGIAADYTHFDPELIMYINGELMHLNQLGVGDVYTITDSSDTWNDFLGEDINRLSIVKPFVWGRVKLLFDPPQSSSAVQALNDQMKEYEWRLNVAVDPTPRHKTIIKKEVDSRLSKYYEDSEHTNIWKDEDVQHNTLIIDKNGIYDIQDYANALVQVLNSYLQTDEGKVVSNGVLVSQESQNIDSNGTYDTTLNNEIVVNVPNSYTVEDNDKVVSNGSLVNQGSQTIESNGTYNTTFKNSVTVNVPNSYTSEDEGKVVSNGELVPQNEWCFLSTFVTSSDGAYIDTEYVCKNNTKIEMIADVSMNNNPHACLFGARNDVNANASNAFCAYQDEDDLLFFVGPKPENKKASVVINKNNYSSFKSKYVLTRSSYMAFYGATSVFEGGTFASGSVDDTNSLYLFSLNQNGSDAGSDYHCKGSIYRVRIYEGDVLVHEFVPWMDDNHIVCMKDNITGDVKYSSGSGRFLIGWVSNPIYHSPAYS